jgi:hypothetical protein
MLFSADGHPHDPLFNLAALSARNVLIRRSGDFAGTIAMAERPLEIPQAPDVRDQSRNCRVFSSGSFSTFGAIRRASSLVSNLAADSQSI